MRIVIAIVCFVIIVIRFLVPSFNFDSTSLILFVIALILLLFPELQDLIGRIRRVKIGQYELEFSERLRDLVTKTEEAEESAEETGEELKHPAVSDEILDKVEQLSADPRASLIMIAIRIEQAIRSIASENEIPESQKFIPLTKLVSILADKKIISSDIVYAFKDFWSIRNQLIHGLHFEISQGKLYVLIEIGLRILRLLSIKK